MENPVERFIRMFGFHDISTPNIASALVLIDSGLSDIDCLVAVAIHGGNTGTWSGQAVNHINNLTKKQRIALRSTGWKYSALTEMRLVCMK